MESGTVTVEFLGIPRQRAGRTDLAVVAGTIAETLAAVERACTNEATNEAWIVRNIRFRQLPALIVTVYRR